MRDKLNLPQLLGIGVTVIFVMGIVIASSLSGVCSPPRSDSMPEPSPVPSATPCPRAVVVLDAGHGGFDGGAVGTESGVREDILNLQVAKLLKTELEGFNIRVIPTRETDEALGNSKKDDMQVRENIINTPGADIVVSIHMNKFSDRSIHGPMVFYMKGSSSGESLASSIMTALCTGLNLPERLANPGDYFVLRVGEAPAVIVECGFLSNKNDEMLLQDSEYQLKIAKSVAIGIISYLDEFQTHTP